MTTTDPAQTPTQRAVGHVFARLTLTLSIVWALTTIATAVAAKAGPGFIWILLVLIAGASGSGACVEAARRQASTALRVQD